MRHIIRTFELLKARKMIKRHHREYRDHQKVYFQDFYLKYNLKMEAIVGLLSQSLELMLKDSTYKLIKNGKLPDPMLNINSENRLETLIGIYNFSIFEKMFEFLGFGFQCFLKLKNTDETFRYTVQHVHEIMKILNKIRFILGFIKQNYEKDYLEMLKK